MQVLIPYIKWKLDEYYQDELELELLRQPQDRVGVIAGVRSAFRAVYPYIHAGYELTFAAYLLLYAVGRSKYASPFLHLSGVKYKRYTPPPAAPAPVRAAFAFHCPPPCKSE